MSSILKQIESLNPETDALEIVRLSAFYDFPWDYNRALELALYKTFAVPSISKILHSTREFEHNTQKRYDDTDLIIGEIIEYGFDSPRATKIIDKLNWIHSHYNISNDDYLYVLSTFIFEPFRWINKYGYRKLTQNERIAGFKVFKELGERMLIKDIPDSFEAFEEFNIAYEQKHFRYHINNYKVAKSTEDLMLSWMLPKWSFGIARPFIHAIMDDNLVHACGGKTSPKWLKAIVNNSLSIRSKISSLNPLPKKPQYRSTLNSKTYKNGYLVKDLGPEKLNKLKGCPFH